MTIHKWIFFISFNICMISLLFQIFKILSIKNKRDAVKSSGKVGSAIFYAFTKAMSPLKKETAYLHLPSYTAGIIYHIGTFFSFIWLSIHFFDIMISNRVIQSSILLLIITSLCGFGIFLKRLISKKLRTLSNPDDFISNLLVTGFQILSAFALLRNNFIPILFVYTSILFLYIPLGKLKHLIYFFMSRIHLGIFFGKRGVWPLKQEKT